MLEKAEPCWVFPTRYPWWMDGLW